EKGRPQRHRASRVLPGLRRADSVGRDERSYAEHGDEQPAGESEEPDYRGRRGDLNGVSRFEEAAELWFGKVEDLAREGRRSPGTLETYRRQLDIHVLPAIGQCRLGEATTPLVDKVVGAIKANASSASAKSCQSVISGVLGLPIRYGAIPHNPVREGDRIESL